MRLTALWLCGTLLALTSLSSTTTNSGVGDILGDTRFGPCTATLRREETCRQGQDENSCPYLLSLPPLTVHLPKQLRELEEIVKDLQTLKDNVDQLRKMCSDCTVSQSERECGRHGEKEHEKLNEDTDRHEDGNKWMDERDPGKRSDCGINRVKVERTMEGDRDSDAENRITLDENERKQWDSEKQGETRVIKESEKEDPLKEVTEKDGKNQTEGAKAKVPTSGGKGRTVNMAKETFFGNSNRDGDKDSNKETNGKSVSNGEPEDSLDNGQEKKTPINIENTDKIPGSNHDVRQEETEKVPKSLNKEDRGSDGIKMSEEHDAHLNEEQKQHSEENKRDMGIKVEQNNEKPKQTENIGSTKGEKTIKEGGAEEVDREIKTGGEKTVQGVQRDSDGDSASSKATERTDFVSISPTPRSAIGSDASYDSLDSNAAATFTSSLPSPHLPNSASRSITDANQQTITADSEPPTLSTGAVGIHENQNRPMTDAVNRQTTHARPGAGFQGQVSSATTTTSTHKLYPTAIPAVTGRGRWAAKNNSSKTGFKPLPDRGTNPDKKHQSGVKPKAGQGQKNTKTYQKPDRGLLPNRKPEQKQKPYHQNPTTDLNPEPGKDTKIINISKPDQRASLDNSTTDHNLKPKLGQAGTFSKNRFSNQKPDSHLKSVRPVENPTPPIPVNIELAMAGKDPSTDPQPEYDEMSFINPNSKPRKKLHPPPETNKPEQKQTPGRKTTSEEKHKPDHRSEPNQNLTRVGESESERRETTRFTAKPKTNQNENPSSVPKSKPDFIPGQKLRPAHTITTQTPKPIWKIPKINQKPKPGHMPSSNQRHPGPVTNQKPKPNAKPNPGKTTQTNQGIKTPPSDPRPDLNPKPVPDEIPEAESSKTVKPRPSPRHRPPATPVLKPEATRLQRPKPAVQPKPSPKPSSVSTTTNINHDSQTDPPPAPGAEKHTDGVTHSSENPGLSRSVMGTTTVASESHISMDTGAFTRSYSAAKSFTVSPNRRIPSNTRPPAAGQPSSMPVPTSPNNVMSGTSPASTKPNLSSNTDTSSQPVILHNVEDAALKQSPHPDRGMSPFSSPSFQTASTTSPDFVSATSAKTGPKLPDAESSTPSARELRVKINQVAALLNGSLSQNESPLDRGPKKPLEDKQGGRRPDNRQQTLTPPQAPPPMRDCSDHLLQGETKSGVYLVTPDPRSESVSVLCDMELGGGGWTLIQRRQDGSVSFNRTWAEYRSGFGDLGGGEFWLGNSMIHLLTRDRDMVLRVELQDFDGLRGFAQYEQFRVASERMRFRLTVGGYSGSAGDALRFSRTYDHNHRAFTTPDRDHDRYPSGNCGAYYSSGWWFDACMAANLNGKYYVKRYRGIRDGIFWGTWHNISTEYYPTNYRQSFKSVRMMIRPKGFAP